jgi:hypothetical protein
LIANPGLEWDLDPTFLTVNHGSFGATPRTVLAARAPVHALDGALWLRISAFAYNEIGDYRRLAEIVAAEV